MKKLLIYPFFGSALAGVAGATTLFIDGNQFCPNLCTENPGKNRCCPPNKTITRFDVSQFLSSPDNVFGGVTIGTGNNQQTIIDSEGNFVGTKNLSSETFGAIRNATLSANTAKKIARVIEYGASDVVNVAFASRNGEGISTSRVYKGMTLPTPAQSIRPFDGAVFVGYSTDANGSNMVDKVPNDAVSGDVLYAQYNCGSGFIKNQFDVCVPSKGGGNGDVYIDDDGNEIPLENVDCGYLNTTGTGNSNYCDRTVIVHLHDQPTTTNHNVTNGNEGRTLWCNRVWCYEPYWGQQDGQNGPNANAGALVETIKMPHIAGYKFRGYFYRNGKHMDDLIVDDTHNVNPNDVATGLFYPKNTSDTTNVMGIYSPQDGINIWWDFEDGSTSIQGLPVVTQGSLSGAPGLRMHEIDVYGGWARECAPGTNATCTLEKGISVAHSGNGLKPGQVRYDNGCNGYNHLDENANAYNPTCVADSGNINLSYTFTDQYNVQVDCSTAVTQSCATGSGHNLLNVSGFNNVCGSGYQLRWLNANNKWYSPGKNVSCSTNVFGQSPATVHGYVCRECNATTNGTCVDMTDTNTIHYNVSGNMSNPGHLWGANEGNLNTSACKKLQCNSGYDVHVNHVTGVISCAKQCVGGMVAITDDETGERECVTPYQQCMLSCQKKPEITDCNAFCSNQTFQCPSNFTIPNGMNYTVQKGTGKECTYTVSCSASNAVLEGNATIYCNGTDGNEPCTSTWLTSQFANLNCFTCPNVSTAPTGVSPHLPTQDGLNCTYKASCNNPAYTLYYNNSAVSTPNQMTCAGSAECVVQSISNWYSKHSCQAGGTTPTFSCPSTFNTPTGVKIVGEPERDGTQCTYNLGCTTSGYVLNGSSPITCTGAQQCTSSNLATMVQNYSCTAGEFTCPGVGVSINGVNVTYTPISQEGKCAYKASCTNTAGVCTSNLETETQSKPRDLCEQQLCTGLADCTTLAGLYNANNVSCSVEGESWYMEFELPGVSVAETGGNSN